MRRIQRRMQVLQTHEVPSYIEQLRSQPTEAELLFRELLIGVTRFCGVREAARPMAWCGRWDRRDHRVRRVSPAALIG